MVNIVKLKKIRLIRFMFNSRFFLKALKKNLIITVSLLVVYFLCIIINSFTHFLILPLFSVILLVLLRISIPLLCLFIVVYYLCSILENTIKILEHLDPSNTRENKTD